MATYRAHDHDDADSAPDASKQPRRHLEALHRLTAATARAADVEAIYEEALDALLQAANAQRAAVLLFDPDGVMRFKAWRGLSPAYRASVEGHNPWALDDPAPQPVIIPDVAGDPELAALAGVIQTEGIAAVAFIPLCYGDQLLGKFMLYHDQPHDFPEDEIDLARTIAGHIAFALEKRRLEEELRATSSDLAATLDAVDEGITVQSPYGQLRWANDAAAHLLGFDSAAELLAAPVTQIMSGFDVFDETGAPLPLEALPGRRALAGEEPPEMLLRWRFRATGEERWSLVRARPVADGDGRPRFAVNVFRDVTARQQAVDALRRSEERFALLAAASRTLLAASLDAEAVAHRLAELVVPVLADWCWVWEPPTSDVPEEWCQAVRRSEQSRPDGDPHVPVGDTVWAGQSERLDGVDGLSVIKVPVLVRGNVVAAVVLASVSPGRYTEADVALAEDLASRAGQALSIARAYRAEHEARQWAESATLRLELLAELSLLLASSLNVDHILASLARRVVPVLADHCIVDVVDARGEIRRVAVVTGNSDLGPQLERFPPEPSNADHPIVRALTGQTVVIPRFTDELLRNTITRSPEHLDVVRTLGPTSAVVVPIVGRTKPFGAITLATASSSRPALTRDDVPLVEEIGRRAGVAIENARLYSERSAAAATLTKAFLPDELPEVPGLELAARYRAAAAGVGGDYSDVIRFGDHWLLAIGDVCGKGPEAGALTAMARYTLRTLAHQAGRASEGDDRASPARLLTDMNEILTKQLPDDRFFTMACAALEPVPGGVRATLAVAGHPPPLVVRRSGEVTPCGPDAGLVVGVVENPTFTDTVVDLGPGDALVLFTDGCVGEGRDAEAVLGPTLAAAAGASSFALAEAVEAVADTVQADHPDDVAILVARVLPVRAHAPPGIT